MDKKGKNYRVFERDEEKVDRLLENEEYNPDEDLTLTPTSIREKAISLGIDDCVIYENIERLKLEIYIPNSPEEIIDKLDTYILRRQRLFPAKIIVVESSV